MNLHFWVRLLDITGPSITSLLAWEISDTRVQFARNPEENTLTDNVGRSGWSKQVNFEA